MLQGIALAYHVLSLDLIGRHGLAPRTHGRGGEGEVRFLWTDFPRVLPVWLPAGRLVLATWGNARDESRRLPVARWASSQTFEEGGWARYLPGFVEVPATVIAAGRSDAPVWVGVRQGMQALLVRDEVGRPRV